MKYGTRNPKNENRPKSEPRVDFQAWRAGSCGFRANSDFSFRPAFGLRVAAFGFRRSRGSGFTLIELILVMAILTMAVSVTAPVLANFFRGRSLDSEARRFLALTRSGQNRAVSEGLPMDLWIDVEQGAVGLDAEPSFEKEDPRAVEFKLDPGLKIEVSKAQVMSTQVSGLISRQFVSTASVPPVHLTHAGLPTIRFLPDGTMSDNSPAKVRIVARDGTSLWLVLSREKLKYEIRTNEE